MRIDVGASSDIGQVREGNEDAYLILDPLFAVADGMGGHRGGEVASNLALEIVRSRFEGREGSLTEQVEAANREVFERSQADREVSGMGTTLTAALVEGEQVRLAHVGDSRAYLFRDGELHLLTEDHTLVHRMVQEGEITAEEAETHPHRSILTRALGVDEAVQVDEALVRIRPRDRLLLCTDGLTGMIGDEAIRAVLAETADPQQAVERLVRSANRSGGVDNITAVILDVRDDDHADGPGGGEGGARERHGATARPTERHPLATPTIPVDLDEAGPPSRPKARSGGRVLRTVGLGAGVTLAVVLVGMVLLR
ncbi:MAG TPA: Stp1/IreP family PP2C-type Ser/Thr phosphatase, partial [Actinomycetota bacterium]